MAIPYLRTIKTVAVCAAVVAMLGYHTSQTSKAFKQGKEAEQLEQLKVFQKQIAEKEAENKRKLDAALQNVNHWKKTAIEAQSNVKTVVKTEVITNEIEKEVYVFKCDNLGDDFIKLWNFNRKTMFGNE